MEISSEVPKTMMIAHIPSFELEKSQTRNDLKQDIREREVAYTLDWLGKAMRSEVLSGVNKDDFQFLSNVGRNRDDVLMVAWSKDQMQLEVVDGRFLVLSVRMTGEAQVGIEDIFKSVVNYTYHSSKDHVKVHVENVSSNTAEKAWGRIIVDRGNARGWFEKPIEWYRTGNEMIFAFEKIVKQPDSKGLAQDDYIPYIVGGIPLDDDRSYLRFEKSNRKDLAKEYFRKQKGDEAVQKGIDEETKGRPLHP